MELNAKILDCASYINSYEGWQAFISKMKSSYPLDYQRVDNKTLPVINELLHFSGCKVLDLGCNFGMYSLLASQFSEEVIGLERSGDIFAIANESKKYFEQNGFDISNVRFVHGDVRCIKEIKYNALMMTLVLYHLDNHEVDLLVEDAKSKCDKAIIQCRPGRGVEFHRGALTDHISRNDRFDGLYDIAGCIRLLKEIGLTNIKITVSPELFGREVFPVITAERL